MKVHILDRTTNQLIEADIIDFSKKGLQVKLAKLILNNKEIGRILYSIDKDNLYIHMVYNDQNGRYAKVGTLLVEYVFQLSLTHGKEGRINVSPIPSSIDFWKKLGFEFISKNEMHLSAQAIKAKINSDEFKMDEIKKWAEDAGFKFKKF